MTHVHGLHAALLSLLFPLHCRLMIQSMLTRVLTDFEDICGFPLFRSRAHTVHSSHAAFAIWMFKYCPAAAA